MTTNRSFQTRVVFWMLLVTSLSHDSSPYRIEQNLDLANMFGAY
jgi:hypothetical protein